MGAAVGTGKGPRSDINITPLVDVVLVLLIIFMVLTPLMEKELAVRVPEDTKDEPVQPPDPNEQQWLFKVDDQGRFLLNGTPYTDDAVMEPLKQAYRAAKAKGEAVIFFDADDKAHYVRAVKALDAIRDSSPGWTIGMMTEELPAAPAAPGAPGDAPPAPPAPPK